jgi:glyoxylase-like metal-dependent hydrolase (beta-lactamase superfamily II)
MIGAKAEKAPLKWDVMVTKRPGLSRDVPPGKEALSWVANSVTLISGERDAVLVDTFLTIEHSQALADWIAASGKNLTTIYITHAHGDHFFGLTVIQERFSRARAVATPKVVRAMRQHLSPASIDNFWRKLFPDQIPQHLVAAQELNGNELVLEGHRLVVIDMGHTDTASTTSLHVPSIGLFVAGDAVYNGIHPSLADTNNQSRLEWIAALDRIDELRPRAVIAGHKVPENDDNPRIIDETRNYIQDFIRLDQETTSARELYDRMLELYPERVNPGSLWRSASAAKAWSEKASGVVMNCNSPELFFRQNSVSRLRRALLVLGQNRRAFPV